MKSFALFGFVVVIAAFLGFALKDKEDDKIKSQQQVAAISSKDYNAYTKNILNGVSKADVDKRTLTVALEGDILTTGTMISGFESDAARLLPRAFADFPDLDNVEMRRMAEFKDIRGRSSNALAIRMKFSRANSASVVWRQVALSNLPQIADEYWQHPSLSR